MGLFGRFFSGEPKADKPESDQWAKPEDAIAQSAAEIAKAKAEGAKPVDPATFHKTMRTRDQQAGFEGPEKGNPDHN